jgi:hypothetical protein
MEQDTYGREASTPEGSRRIPRVRAGRHRTGTLGARPILRRRSKLADAPPPPPPPPPQRARHRGSNSGRRRVPRRDRYPSEPGPRDPRVQGGPSLHDEPFAAGSSSRGAFRRMRRRTLGRRRYAARTPTVTSPRVSDYGTAAAAGARPYRARLRTKRGSADWAKRVPSVIHRPRDAGTARSASWAT